MPRGRESTEKEESPSSFQDNSISAYSLIIPAFRKGFPLSVSSLQPA